MGAAFSSENTTQRNDHLRLLTSLRKKNAVSHVYRKGFSGFAARLSKEEAISIEQRRGVVSVFRDKVIHFQTTHSWNYLKYQADNQVDSRPSIGPNLLSNGEETIVGILDTGIWPESKSFNDKGFGAIPARWKGKCMKALDFNTSNCNRKLIGARYYGELGSPRDIDGHGTHIASIIAGSPVSGASYHGVAVGIAKGGSPGSRIAMYRFCSIKSDVECTGSMILKAFDDAIGDGVDLISLSSGSISQDPFKEDPYAIGSFHAVQKGITVICAGGNLGPKAKTVSNVAPWVITVAATTMDRYFQCNVVLGNNKTIKGGGLNYGKIQKSPVYPLLYTTRNCNSLDPIKMKGKIVLCEAADFIIASEIIQLGVVGIIKIDDNPGASAWISDALPLAVVTSKDAAEILSYINSTTNPVATISPTITVTNYKPAPVVIDFSSRGPSYIAKNILKPDIAAPGVDILGAWTELEDKITSPYNFESGTSFSCPHVSGVAATIKSQKPLWSPSAIKSAMMTTAITRNNLKAPITTESGLIATPFDIGAGEVCTTGPLHPGLIYETEIVDYLQFLCNIGYDLSTIKLIANSIPDGFFCSNTTSEDEISNINYPSISISKLQAYKSKNVKRTVKNVGEDNSTYVVRIETPVGLHVDVTPSKLKFTSKNQKQSYTVTFTSQISPKEDMFGSITWTNGKYKVRSPFVVNGN